MQVLFTPLGKREVLVHPYKEKLKKNLLKSLKSGDCVAGSFSAVNVNKVIFNLVCCRQ